MAILHIGETLIRTKGYHSFSYKDIASVLDIKNAAVHYHYPAKEDLGNAVLDKAISSVINFSEHSKALPYREQFKKFLHTYFESNDKDMVCLMGALSASYEELPKGMKTRLKTMGETILDWVSNCLKEGKRKGEFHFNEKPGVKAEMIVSNMLAALLLSRVLGKKHFETIYNQVLAAI